MTTENSLTTRLVILDVLMITLLSILALSPLAAVFAGPRWVLAAAGGLVIGVGVTLVARKLNWGPWLTAIMFVLTYILFGPALAVPGSTIAGVVPTLDGVRDILYGSVEAWRNALTLQPLLTGEYQVFVVPLLVAAFGALFTGTFLWRSKWPSLAGLGIFAMFIAAASFGANVTEFSLARGLILVTVLVVWTRWRAMRHFRASWPRRIAMTTAVVLAAGVVGVGVSVAVSPGNRLVLRDHVDPPMKRLDFKSPLSKYRTYYKDHDKKVMFTVEGLPEGAHVRLAVMDEYDGIVWNVNTMDHSTKTSAFVNPPKSTSSDAIKVSIAEDYSGPWVPTIGGTTGVSLVTEGKGDGARQLLFNPAAGTVAQVGNVRAGDVYKVDWGFGSVSDIQSTDQTDRGVVTSVPQLWPQLDKLVQTWLAEAGAGSDLEIIQTIEKKFKDGYFSNGLADEPFVVPSGHGARRLADLVVEPEQMIGNGEQYAAVMALVLQSQGIPARAVLGFEESAGPTFTGGEIAAWVEVKFVDSGWQAFNPTPPKDRQPTALSKDPNPAPQPNVIQPPVIPKEPEQANTTPPEGSGKNFAENIWAFLKMLLGYVWIAVKWAAVLSPLWLILLVKYLRKRRRRRAEDPIARTSGAWREVTDRARDLGTRLPESQTRYENSVLLTERYPEVEMTQLATVADRHVFGPTTPTDAETDAYWADIDTALTRMRKSAPWWRRLLSWFSPASIPWRQARSSAASTSRKYAHIVRQSRAGRAVENTFLKIWNVTGKKLMNRKRMS